MAAQSPSSLLDRIEALRADLVELAFTLDRRGQLAAADVAMEASARLSELRDEFARTPAEAAIRGNFSACCPERLQPNVGS